jgi:glutamate-ammonia-ligase adenylyltransferase
VAAPHALAAALDRAPDPDLARRALARVRERPAARALLARPEVAGPAVRLLGFSSAASDFFLAHPEELEALADLRPRSPGELLEEARAAASRLGPGAGLRRFRRRASYRVAARDLSGAPLEEVVAELTAVAEACLRVAAEAVGHRGLAVVGMGKLGGRELNYASDVDVLFVHAEPGAAAQEEACRAAARLIELLARPTEEGVALRVDPDLRPGGRSGPLSRSLSAMVDHYARHAATWERQALLKARPVAGDLELGTRFVEAVVPFVYPAVLPASAIDDVRETKARVEEHVRSLGKERREVKRGWGGIRDVEFAVQLLQLVHGRRYSRLRDANTLEALRALAEEGFVSEADARALAESYRFLRRLEHRLQMVRELQTHELPEDPRALESLGRSLGLVGADELRTEHARHTRTVRGLHERLFYRPLLEAFAGPPVPRPGVDRAATEELLAGLGFAVPDRAYETFSRVVDRSTRLGRVLGTLFPVVAPPLALAATPDAALVRFSRVVEALGRGWGADALADALADRPDAARRLASLVAVSSAFADLLVARPELALALRDHPGGPGPFEGGAEAELVRVAGAHAAGELPVPECGRRLAAVADAVVAEALAEAEPRLPLAVVGLGKLGGQELSFGSDLDLLFVYEGEGPADFTEASWAAERALEALRARGWTPDPDLRPEGRSGPLARSLASYVEYWQRWAEVWEAQALLRARFVGGDPELGARFLAAAAPVAYPERLTFEQVAAIRRMRVRMEEERVRPRDARRFHFKLGHGGLADVQFAVELSLMRHGSRHPEVRRTHTLEALEALAAARLLEDSVARALGEAYLFLMEVKTALEVERRVAVEALPPTPEAQAALARRLGYGERARSRFLQEYRRVTARARSAMERVFYEDEG